MPRVIERSEDGKDFILTIRLRIPVAEFVKNGGLPRKTNVLSRRESEVFDLIQQGKTNKEIGLALHITERTAKYHVSSILSRFDVRRRYDLLRITDLPA